MSMCVIPYEILLSRSCHGWYLFVPRVGSGSSMTLMMNKYTCIGPMRFKMPLLSFVCGASEFLHGFQSNITAQTKQTWSILMHTVQCKTVTKKHTYIVSVYFSQLATSSYFDLALFLVLAFNLSLTLCPLSRCLCDGKRLCVLTEYSKRRTEMNVNILLYFSVHSFKEINSKTFITDDYCIMKCLKVLWLTRTIKVLVTVFSVIWLKNSFTM